MSIQRSQPVKSLPGKTILEQNDQRQHDPTLETQAERAPQPAFKTGNPKLKAQNSRPEALDDWKEPATLNSTTPTALDPQWLKKNVPRFLRREGEGQAVIERLEILNSWESEKRTTILYQLELRDATGTKRQQTYVGYLVAGERLDKEYKSASKKAKIEPAIGRAVVLIPEANLVLLACPNDRKLASLSEESLRAWLESSLHRIAGRALSRRQWHMQEMTIETLRHVPDKRRTTRCRVRMRADNGLRGEIAFIAKQLNDSKKARALFRNLRALATAWPNPECDTKAGNTGLGKIRPPVRLPQALGLYDEKAVVFVEELEGENMLEALPELDLAQVMPAVGELLAHFHRAQRRVRKSVSRPSELNEVRSATQTIGVTIPHLQS